MQSFYLKILINIVLNRILTNTNFLHYEYRKVILTTAAFKSRDSLWQQLKDYGHNIVLMFNPVLTSSMVNELFIHLEKSVEAVNLKSFRIASIIGVQDGVFVLSNEVKL